jgi:hypothetical protein
MASGLIASGEVEDTFAGEIIERVTASPGVPIRKQTTLVYSNTHMADVCRKVPYVRVTLIQ